MPNHIHGILIIKDLQSDSLNNYTTIQTRFEVAKNENKNIGGITGIQNPNRD